MTDPLADDLVDAHVHLWDPDHLHYAWLAGSPLRREFSAQHFAAAAPSVTGVVAVQADCQDGEAVAEVRWLCAQFADGPELVGIVAYAPVEAGHGVARMLARLAAAGPVVGIRRLLQDEAPGFTRRGGVDAGLSILTRFGVPFDLCVRAHQLDEIVELVERHPEQVFVLDHLGKPRVGDPETWPGWQANLTRLARHPRLTVKLSGLLSELAPGVTAAAARRYLEFALDTFGPARCLFGSDWPVVTEAGGHDAWLELVLAALALLTAQEQAAVLAGNARRTYARRLIPDLEETRS